MTDDIEELKNRMVEAERVFKEAKAEWQAAVAGKSEFKVGDDVFYHGKPARITRVFERWGKPAYRVAKIKKDGEVYASDVEAWGSITKP